MNIEHFTPIPSLLGGVLIGTAASLLLLGNGKVAGISGIVAGVMRSAGERGWRVLFLVGLVLGGALVALLEPAAIGTTTRPLALLAVAGLLVGFGTRLGGGCTSGHGVCGLSRLSKRSLIATLTFMTTAAVAVFAVHQLSGGAL
jgi:uncharacterized membrane protein YedE/YeeE